MWFVTAMIGVVGVGLMAMLINQNRLPAIPRTDFVDGSLHSWSCVSNCSKNSIHSFAHEHRCRMRESSISVNRCGYNTCYLQYSL